MDYLLLPKLIPEHPIAGEEAPSLPTFVFGWGENPIGVAFWIVRVADSDGRVVWITRPRRIAAGYDRSAETLYNADGQAVSPALTPGRTYRWRIDAIGGDERSGSESAWQLFRVRFEGPP